MSNTGNTFLSGRTKINLLAYRMSKPTYKPLEIQCAIIYVELYDRPTTENSAKVIDPAHKYLIADTSGKYVYLASA